MGFLLETRGGTNEERLYLEDDKLDCNDDIIIFRKTDMPNMDHLIARHKGRYCIPAAFCRPKMKVLDFPCGSGYGEEIFRPFGVYYEGMDVDEATILYAELHYHGEFSVQDLTNPHLEERRYDLIASIEGLEHIEEKFQSRLIDEFYKALVWGGILVVTTPEKWGETTNQYHKHELTKEEFEKLLKGRFKDVQILEIKDEVHTGAKTNLLFAIARKED
jgi:2-polyprenyl-3-methyl-5-hydroxy-6-metoxy-1,4-benzoquinol methylase